MEAHLWLNLKEAEEDLIAGKKVQIEVPGNSPAEQISIISAAIWIVEKMREDANDFRTALIDYQEKIRRTHE
ncbi:MAG: hypothetical protein OER04_14470 [Cyclobacteriaceae bacterium]|nr:hypothetical protein [Cyclobacteriaceae bacterium]